MGRRMAEVAGRKGAQLGLNVDWGLNVVCAASLL